MAQITANYLEEFKGRGTCANVDCGERATQQFNITVREEHLSYSTTVLFCQICCDLFTEKGE